MAVYAVFHSTVTDPDKMQAYMEQVIGTIPGEGVRPLAIDDNTQTLEGETPHHRTVIVEFDSEDRLRGWYESDAYKAIRGLRHEGTEGFALVVQGLPPQG